MAMEMESCGQKFLLVRRDEHGFFRKVKLFDIPPTPDEVLEAFGPAYYIVRRCHPRFKTEWKQFVGDPSQSGENSLSKSMKNLEKKTKYLGVGLLGSFGTQALGFGLTHFRFSSLETRMASVEAILSSQRAVGIFCGNCGASIEFLLQKACSKCGIPIAWDQKRPVQVREVPFLPMAESGR